MRSFYFILSATGSHQRIFKAKELYYLLQIFKDHYKKNKTIGQWTQRKKKGGEKAAAVFGPKMNHNQWVLEKKKKSKWFLN